MTNRFFVSPETIKNNKFEITDTPLIHQMTKVLRFQVGEVLELLDNTGKIFAAEVTDISSKMVSGIVNNVTNVPDRPRFKINLCIALLKGEKLDLVFQKGTELGVSIFTPMITANCVKKSSKISDRWIKITQEAAEQCNRTQIPIINEVMKFNEVVEKYSPGFICYEPAGSKLHHKQVPIGDAINIYIGPEGDFTEAELETAILKKLEPVNLGSSRLRAETAAITAVAILNI
jgi:16S rRNA (uracil1498-N3)-methyltransferase